MLPVVIWKQNTLLEILQGCFTGTGAIIWLPQCLWSNPEVYGLWDHKNPLQLPNQSTVQRYVFLYGTWYIYTNYDSDLPTSSTPTVISDYQTPVQLTPEGSLKSAWLKAFRPKNNLIKQIHFCKMEYLWGNACVHYIILAWKRLELNKTRDLMA